MKIGHKLKEHRHQKGFSLRELGEKAGVSASFLSQVENDQVSPSLNSLQSIARALEIPMFSFLNDTPGGSVVREDNRRRLNFEDDRITYDLLTPDFSRDMVAYLISIDPGVKRIAQPLAKPTQQWMHVLSGTLEIVIGEDHYCLNEGDTVYYDGELLREFGSPDQEALKVLCCITPPVL